MSIMTGSLGAYDVPLRTRPGRVIAVALAILTPLLLAVAAFASVSGSSSAAPSGAPALPAAIVNLDQIVTTTVNGTSTPVAAGKLLTTQLSQNGGGFAWTITDQDSAESGLRAGTYSAVVTIPSNFSAAYLSSSGASPVQAQLSVETNGAQNYVIQPLASALSSGIDQALSAQLTQGFVKNTLVGFTTLHTQLGQAASGAQQLATGTSQFVGYLSDAATGSVQLASGADQLASGLTTVSNGVDALPGASRDLATLARGTSDVAKVLDSGLGDLTDLQLKIDAKQAEVDAAIADLKDETPTLTNDQIVARLAEIQTKTGELNDLNLKMSAGILLAKGGSALVSGGAGLVADGNEALAGKMPELASGLDAAATGANGLASGMDGLSTGLQQLSTSGGTLASSTQQLANGLTTAANSVPSYTADQQQTLSTVVATPITTNVKDIAGPANAQSAIAAVIIPIALWLGALALFLVLVPVAPDALASTASSWRIVARSLLPVGAIALAQALLVLVISILFGLRSDQRVAAVGLILLMALAFALVHHGLVTAFGRVGRVLSIALLALQVLAAGVVIPAALNAPWMTGIASVLPLTQAIRGLQTAIAGGDAVSLLSVALCLVALGLVGLALSVIHTARHRSLPLVGA